MEDPSSKFEKISKNVTMKAGVTAGCCDSQHQHNFHDDESTRNNDAQDESSQTNLSFQRPVIGSQVGQELVDIINGLHPTFTNINSLIFQYLNPYDLCVMCLVSKSWNQIVKSDSIANSRRIKRLKKIRRIKADVGQVISY